MQAVKYLILNKRRVGGVTVGGVTLWWLPNRTGYTTDIDKAGRYKKEEAEAIASLRGDDFPVPENELGRGLTIRRTVCAEDGFNFSALEDLERRWQ
jgi:hypothetical protein